MFTLYAISRVATFAALAAAAIATLWSLEKEEDAAAARGTLANQ